MLRYLEPVMTNLSAPDTGLERFISASAAAAAEVAPVAEVQAELFVNLDSTFTALARVARPFIQETISETPPTFAVAERALPTIRPFLDHSAELFTELEPGVDALARYAPPIADTLETGTPVLSDSPQLNRELVPDRRGAARLQRRPGRARWSRAPRPDGGHRRPGAPLHHPGPDRVQLREPVPGQPRRGDRRGACRHEVAAVLGVSAAHGSQQRGWRRLGAGQRWRRLAQLPPLQPLPEHRGARPAE